MSQSASSNRPLNRYVALVTVLGACCVAGLVVADHGSFDRLPVLEVLVFSVLALLGDCFPLRVIGRGAEGEITTSTCFVLAMMLVGGPLAGLASLLAINVIVGAARRTPVHKVAFNLGQYAITVAASSSVLRLTSGLPHAHAPRLMPGDLPGTILAGATFFLVNTALVSTVIALSQRTAVFRRLADDVAFHAISAGLLLGLAPVAVIAADFSLPSIALLFLPLYAVHRGSRETIAKQHQSLHDALTGLPNRELFRLRIELALLAALREEQQLAVMIIDLDHFKEINDTLGHHHGDVLLEQVGAQVPSTLPAGATVARLGGDEFGVLLPRVGTGAAALDAAERILASLRETFSVDGMRLEVDASVGLALFPEHGADVATLIQRADIAMYAAKQTGRGCAMFKPEDDHHSPRRLSVASSLRAAIHDGRMELYYQPKAEVGTGAIVGVEALARWRHPEHGLLGPGEFVPIAEQSGLIAPLTSFVLDEAIRQTREWRDEGLEMSMAINLSARSFLDARLAAEVPEILRRWDVPSSALELEITESMLMTDSARARATVDRLHEIGLTLCVDDFGTGYSSLANLRRLAVHVLKIDRSFVTNMSEDASDCVIVRSTINLAHSLGLRVVAEGVEDSAAWHRLRAFGCDLAQGFYIASPMPAADAAAFIRSRQGEAAAATA